MRSFGLNREQLTHYEHQRCNQLYGWSHLVLPGSSFRELCLHHGVRTEFYGRQYVDRTPCTGTHILYDPETHNIVRLIISDFSIYL